MKLEKYKLSDNKKLQEAFDSFGKQEIDLDKFIMRYTDEVYYQIVKSEDEYLKQFLIKWAKEHNKKLRIIDEDIVKTIIDLGISEYCRINNCKLKGD